MTFQRLEDNCSEPNEKTPDSFAADVIPLAIAAGVTLIYHLTTITVVTLGEGRTFKTMVEQHKTNTDSNPVHVAADKACGTAENYQYLHEQRIAPCIPHKHHTATNTKTYPKSKFTYVAEADYYATIQKAPAGVKSPAMI